MEDLCQIAYVSAAARLLDDDDLKALLTEARSRNEQLGVTGILLYCEGGFLQVLEGKTLVVQQLYAHICEDPRHKLVIQLLERPLAAREFEGWAMAFRRTDASDVAELTGLSGFLQGRGVPDHMRDDASTQTLKLIQQFRASNC